jgi:hypothetical protein
MGWQISGEVVIRLPAPPNFILSLYSTRYFAPTGCATCTGESQL